MWTDYCYGFAKWFFDISDVHHETIHANAADDLAGSVFNKDCAICAFYVGAIGVSAWNDAHSHGVRCRERTVVPNSFAFFDGLDGNNFGLDGYCSFKVMITAVHGFAYAYHVELGEWMPGRPRTGGVYYSIWVILFE